MPHLWQTTASLNLPERMSDAPRQEYQLLMRVAVFLHCTQLKQGCKSQQVHCVTVACGMLAL